MNKFAKNVGFISCLATTVMHFYTISVLLISNVHCILQTAFFALRFFDLEEVINLRPPAVSLHPLPSHFVSFSNMFEPGLILPLSNRYNCHCLNHSTHQVRQSWLQ